MASAADSGWQADALESEQSALLREYVLAPGGGDAGHRSAAERWSSRGATSLAPFAPCAANRLAHIYAALRLGCGGAGPPGGSAEREGNGGGEQGCGGGDVLWDLGCGDGRVLIEAACRYPALRAVGVELDAECLAGCRRRAAAAGPGVAARCEWVLADLTDAPEGFLATGELVGEQGAPDGGGGGGGGGSCGGGGGGGGGGRAARLPAPTAVLAFLTGAGLTSLAPTLRREYELGSFVLSTCVEALDTCLDFGDAAGVFAATNELGWEVYRGPEAKYGVFVVPPRDALPLEAWAASRPAPAPADARAADALGAAVLHGVLSAEDIAAVDALARSMLDAEEATGSNDGAGVGDAQGTATASGDDADDLSAALLGALFDDGGGEDGFCSAVEDAVHSLGTHRVVHLHRDGAIEAQLPAVRAKLLAAMYDADARLGWGLLRGRAVNVRSMEWHGYTPGGGVTDRGHRDTGSLLTMSVLLSSPSSFEGAAFSVLRGEGSENERWVEITDVASPGDAVIFPSELVHNVATLTKGTRRSCVVELHEGGIYLHNRHR